MTDKLIDIETPDGPVKFTSELSQRAYKLNEICYSLKIKANRDLFRADYKAYIKDYNLSEFEEKMIDDRDWLKMAHYGVSAYVIGKMVDCFDQSFIDMGAGMRGETQEEFMKKRAPLIKNVNPDEGDK
ncbi:hypothetical protein [Pseudemcibacter aquimaris]|uniref:hypothetical protein n=1 Tax=Pseudemcibacter aquimaris TaxID=2857064 RepID=UPI00201175ED|nr:hypothetical protein [Pseudemcibacter aquimaris]MCC3860199.1 hypothetical protein [Pseudemcibacter aquimaris]WDU57524.1 hypothetical protein KW060_09990 [Pseudemcibacter aquimaris]